MPCGVFQCISVDFVVYFGVYTDPTDTVTGDRKSVSQSP